MTLENLLEQDGFNNELQACIASSGRA
jgi:hypothetical protein